MLALIKLLVLSIFGAKKTVLSPVNNVVEGLETSTDVRGSNMYITYESYITASGKYKDRLVNKELTQELIDNANKLVDTLNSFFVELGEVKEFKVSSGFRPSEVNKNITGAAKKSYHTLCLACDIADKDGKIAKIVKSRPDLLRKHNLFMENPDNTVGWCHLDLGIRQDRPNRIFNP